MLSDFPDDTAGTWPFAKNLRMAHINKVCYARCMISIIPRVVNASRAVYFFSTNQKFLNRTGHPWFCRWIGPGSGPSFNGAAVVAWSTSMSL